MARSSRRVPKTQLPLLDDGRLTGIVNVASVPQRSVFRYPGGKTWLVPYIRKWLRALPDKPAEFIEPFAGGGIVGLTVAFEGLAERVTLVELDDQVAAVWHTLLSADAVWLAERIAAFNFSVALVQEELARPATSLREKAFQTILKNRVNRGGILAAGAGRVKRGENDKGLASRWYPQTLRKRILDIAAFRGRIEFIEGDGIEVIQRSMSRADTAFFIDPPYTHSGKRAGNRLYTHAQIDHEVLFDKSCKLSGALLMTYDNTEEIRKLAEQHGLAFRAIPMKSTHHAELTELLISRNLGWLDGN